MSRDVMPGKRPVADHLHPRVYAALVGLALWLVLSVWGFAGPYYTDFVLVVVSAFVFMALAIPYTLWRVGRRNQAADAAGRSDESIGHWLSGEFNTGQDRVKATNAAIEILLPIAAVAFGMTAFAIVLHLSAHAGSLLPF